MLDSSYNRVKFLSNLGFALGLLFSVGCGDGMTRNPDPIEFSVKVTSGGKPVSGVNLGLNPTGVGLPAGVVLTDGAGQGRAIAGQYMYFVAIGDYKDPTKLKEAAAVIESIPEKYRQADPSRVVTVSSGGTVEVKLD